jgi:SAM-dependent MidA family methyltransferase
MLRERITEEIRRDGPISFSRYMQICLYDPTEGYYSRNAEQFGKAGDFYTSSDVHAVFGRLMARQFEEIWRVVDRPAIIEILELGSGRGLFARDVLDWSSKKFPDFFAALRYTLQEASPALVAKLAENLREHITNGKAAPSVPHQDISVKTPLAANDVSDEQHRGGETRLDASPALPRIQRGCPAKTPLIVFANEFFDALPVEILSSRGKLHITAENDRLQEIWSPPTAEELEFLDRYSVHPEAGERVEVPLVAQHWMAQIADSIQRGFALIFDYGYTRAEQLAGRHRGTLMAYRAHTASTNPYQAPGEQDLTTHVNFTALAAAAEQHGMQTQKFLTQSQILMGIGQQNQFADAFEDCRLPQERAKVALQLKHLVTPAGMGETFHVLFASRGVGEEQIRQLSGLTFAT